jgi:CrcB protein
MQTYLWIGIGSALGGMGRHWCNGLMARLAGVSFPWGTITINILGSFVIGFAATVMSGNGRWPTSVTAQHFVMVGLCGGFTTFSAFSLQTLALIQGNQWGAAAANVLISVVVCMVAVWLGYTAGMALNPATP